ncbi:hypothetical protein D3C73_1610930 [compost metagenome]
MVEVNPSPEPPSVITGGGFAFLWGSNEFAKQAAGLPVNHREGAAARPLANEFAPTGTRPLIPIN